MKLGKHMKRAAKTSMKRHYILFVVVCLLCAYLGSEFHTSLNALNITPSEEEAERAEENSKSVNGGMLVKQDGIIDIILDLIEGKDEEGRRKADEIKKQEIERSENANPVFTRSRGVLAQAINAVSSGSIIVTVITAVSSMLGSRDAAVIMLIVLSLTLWFGLWYFIQNTVLVIARRIFLEGRIYESIPIKRFLFLHRLKKWGKASFTMFLLFVYQMLWDFTVIGGIIKRYSYYMVPYIVAENPDVGANEAITLSRKMMKGHKWECFVLELSFLGWHILGALSAGLVDIFYTNSYKSCTFCEYYVHLRRLAKEQKVENAGVMNDRYLYEKAEPEVRAAAYGDVLEVLSQPPKELKSLKGIHKFLADWFGIILFNTKEEQEYEKNQAERVRIQELKTEAEGTSYPGRLYSIPEKMRRKRTETLYYMRHYTIWSLIMLFFIFAFIGWVWEVSLHLVSDGEFVNRGVLHGPWLPIYGAGGILILTLLYRFRKHPVAEFISTVVVCGIVEYGTSYYLEITHNGKKWWDYTGYFLNINGRICAEGLLVFGLGGMAIVYLLAPLLDNHIRKIKAGILIPICLCLVITFSADQVYSGKHPNTGKGITDYAS